MTRNEEGGCRPLFQGISNVLNNEPKLRPCPFCGATELKVGMNEWTRTWSVACPNFHTFECVTVWKSKEETIEEWNRRCGE